MLLQSMNTRKCSKKQAVRLQIVLHSTLIRFRSKSTKLSTFYSHSPHFIILVDFLFRHVQIINSIFNRLHSIALVKFDFKNNSLTDTLKERFLERLQKLLFLFQRFMICNCNSIEKYNFKCRIYMVSIWKLHFHFVRLHII